MGVVTASLTSNVLYTAALDPATQIFPFIEKHCWDWVSAVNDPGLQMPQRLSACTSFTTSSYVGFPLLMHHPGKALGLDPISGNYGVNVITQITGRHFWTHLMTDWSASSANNARGSYTIIWDLYYGTWWTEGVAPVPRNFIAYCADPGNRFFVFFSSTFGTIGFAELLRPESAIVGNLPPEAVGYGWCVFGEHFDHPLGIGRLGSGDSGVWAPTYALDGGGQARIENPMIITRYWPVWGRNRILGFMPPGIGLTGGQTKLNRIRAYGVNYTYVGKYMAVRTSDS